MTFSINPGKSTSSRKKLTKLSSRRTRFHSKGAESSGIAPSVALGTNKLKIVQMDNDVAPGNPMNLGTRVVRFLKRGSNGKPIGVREDTERGTCERSPARMATGWAPS